SVGAAVSAASAGIAASPPTTAVDARHRAFSECVVFIRIPPLGQRRKLGGADAPAGVCAYMNVQVSLEMNTAGRPSTPPRLSSLSVRRFHHSCLHVTERLTIGQRSRLAIAHKKHQPDPTGWDYHSDVISMVERAYNSERSHREDTRFNAA